MFVQIDKRS